MTQIANFIKDYPSQKAMLHMRTYEIGTVLTQITTDAPGDTCPVVMTDALEMLLFLAPAALPKVNVVRARRPCGPICFHALDAKISIESKMADLSKWMLHIEQQGQPLALAACLLQAGFELRQLNSGAYGPGSTSALDNATPEVPS